MPRLTSLRRRPAVVILVAMVALVAMPVQTLAGVPIPPPDSSTGRVGPHGFAEDTSDSPAGLCRYGIFVGKDYFNHIRRIGVDAPVAFARASRPTQKIGFQIVAQDFEDDSWGPHARSTWTFRTATPSAAAMFSKRSLPVDYDGTNSPFRVKVKLRWYARDGQTVVGRATMFPHWYRTTEQGSTHEQEYDCGGTTG